MVTIQEDFDRSVKTRSNFVKCTQGNNFYLYESFFHISRCSFEAGLMWHTCDNVRGPPQDYTQLSGQLQWPHSACLPLTASNSGFSGNFCKYNHLSGFFTPNKFRSGHKLRSYQKGQTKKWYKNDPASFLKEQKLPPNWSAVLELHSFNILNLILHSAEPVISNTFKTALTNVGCTMYDYLLLKHMKQTAAKLSKSSLKTM